MPKEASVEISSAAEPREYYPFDSDYLRFADQYYLRCDVPGIYTYTASFRRREKPDEPLFEQEDSFEVVEAPEVPGKQDFVRVAALSAKGAKLINERETLPVGTIRCWSFDEYAPFAMVVEGKMPESAKERVFGNRHLVHGSGFGHTLLAHGEYRYTASGEEYTQEGVIFVPEASSEETGPTYRREGNAVVMASTVPPSIVLISKKGLIKPELTIKILDSVGFIPHHDLGNMAVRVARCRAEQE